MKCSSYKKNFLVKNIKNEFDNFSEFVEQLKVPKGFIQYLLYVISELFTNIEEHSEAKKAKIQIEIRKKFVSLEVEDKGIGIRRSYLKRKIIPKDDFSAIDFALSGLSTKNLSERGFGLYSVQNLTRKINGKLVIETGKARVTLEKERKEYQKIPPRKGTKIKINAPIKEIDFYKYLEQ